MRYEYTVAKICASH